MAKLQSTLSLGTICFMLGGLATASTVGVLCTVTHAVAIALMLIAVLVTGLVR